MVAAAPASADAAGGRADAVKGVPLDAVQQPSPLRQPVPFEWSAHPHHHQRRCRKLRFTWRPRSRVQQSAVTKADGEDWRTGAGGGWVSRHDSHASTHM